MGGVSIAVIRKRWPFTMDELRYCGRLDHRDAAALFNGANLGATVTTREWNEDGLIPIVVGVIPRHQRNRVVRLEQWVP